MQNLQDVFRGVDWTLLSEQKLTLIQQAETLRRFADASRNQAHATASQHLAGLINLLDAIQDAAEKDGFPVVLPVAETEAE